MTNSTEYKAFKLGVMYVLSLLQTKYPMMAAMLISHIPKELLVHASTPQGKKSAYFSIENKEINNEAHKALMDRENKEDEMIMNTRQAKKIAKKYGRFVPLNSPIVPAQVLECGRWWKHKKVHEVIKNRLVNVPEYGEGR